MAGSQQGSQGTRAAGMSVEKERTAAGSQWDELGSHGQWGAVASSFRSDKVPFEM